VSPDPSTAPGGVLECSKCGAPLHSVVVSGPVVCEYCGTVTLLERPSVRSYVHGLLKEYLQEGEFSVDADGDVPIHFGSTSCWVTVFEDSSRPEVQVWSYMGRDVPESDALYKYLNDLNASIKYGQVYWRNRNVVVSYYLFAEGLQLRELANACERIGRTADAHDDEVVARFGGRTQLRTSE
jgi:DNA-directed RNA polymerase subunit RPC12/RpoP